DFPAHCRKPAAFGAGAKSRALDDDDRAPLVRVDPGGASGLNRERTELRAVRVGRADVHREGTVVEGVGSTRRAIDELVADDEIARSDAGLQASRGTGTQDPGD